MIVMMIPNLTRQDITRQDLQDKAIITTILNIRTVRAQKIFVARS